MENENSTHKTQRFSNRVENYIQYRPHYPPRVIDSLRSNCRLAEDSIIADVGSGTGIMSEMFLRNGNLVYGVEPNLEMREAGVRLLQRYPRFRSVDGMAKKTTLAAGIVDFVTSGQAFHWFDTDKARIEFKRILKPGGWLVLVWNERRGATTPLGDDYEKMLQSYGTDYKKVTHKRINAQTLQAFFGSDFFFETFENSQSFDFEGLKGRLLSSSYSPVAGHPNHESMLAELRIIFDKHEVGGRVVFQYDTKLYYGRLSPS